MHRAGRRTGWASVVALLLLVAATFVSPAAQADAPASDEKTAAFEVEFMTDMIDHHQMAVMMAETCTEKAVHEELAAMCEQIIAVQTQEIEMMQTWLQDWYGVEHEPMMTSGMMRSMEHLQRLEGADYEIAFMRSMTRHHWGAIREAETCLDRAEHEELLSLCEDIKAAQLEEIAQMQEWLADWYGITSGRPVDTDA